MSRYVLMPATKEDLADCRRQLNSSPTFNREDVPIGALSF